MITPSLREAFADAIGRELATARKAWRQEREIAQAEYRQTIAELRAEVVTLKLALHDLASAQNATIAAQLGSIKSGDDGRDGIDGKDGSDGKQGEKGEPGADGKDGAPGQDGRDGKDGARGAEGPAGKFPVSRRWKDCVHDEGAFVTHKGSTWQALCTTGKEPPHEHWLPIAEKGADAPVGEVRGLYDPEASYCKLDLVSKDGAEWRAKHDNPGPLPGDGWVMSARQGKPGGRGEQGERGEPGVAGRDGLQGPAAPKLIKRTLDKFMLVDTLSDGTVIKCNVRPAFELYHSEATK